MIELRDVSVSFGELNVLKEINITFFPGEVIGLVAPNGTGKSTMLNVMMNYLQPKEGEVIIDEVKRYSSAKETSKIYQLISMMPDQNDLYNHLSGYDHLKLYQEMWQSNHLEVNQVIERLQMAHYIKKKVGDYSLGMKQRLCFAMQIVSDTLIMLMDEVMNGLDPNNVELISNVILEKKEEGKTIVIASHLLQNLEKYATRIYFLSEGQLELFLDKKDGYQDQSTYIKLSGKTVKDISDLFPNHKIRQLNDQDLLIKLNKDEQLENCLNRLVKANYLNFSVGYLSLEDAYQLKFQKK